MSEGRALECPTHQASPSPSHNCSHLRTPSIPPPLPLPATLPHTFHTCLHTPVHPLAHSLDHTYSRSSTHLDISVKLLIVVSSAALSVGSKEDRPPPPAEVLFIRNRFKSAIACTALLTSSNCCDCRTEGA